MCEAWRASTKPYEKRRIEKNVCSLPFPEGFITLSFLQSHAQRRKVMRQSVLVLPVQHPGTAKKYWYSPATGEKGEKLENGPAHQHDMRMEQASPEPMDTSKQFCPNPACSARGQIGQGNIRIHDRSRQRYRCRACGHTWSARRGTMMEGLRKPTELIVIVITLLAYGCPIQAIVHAFGLDERTVESPARSGWAALPTGASGARRAGTARSDPCASR